MGEEELSLFLNHVFVLTMPSIFAQLLIGVLIRHYYLYLFLFLPQCFSQLIPNLDTYDVAETIKHLSHSQIFFPKYPLLLNSYHSYTEGLFQRQYNLIANERYEYTRLELKPLFLEYKKRRPAIGYLTLIITLRISFYKPKEHMRENNLIVLFIIVFLPSPYTFHI
jgi:hypothetical protein